MNAYYVAPTNWKWDGTSDFQGNTGQALYEMPMSETSFTYAGALGFRVHCSINAPPWDKEPCGEL